ncbi:SnoaL-like domain-containing protein [Friedmanniella luteola]|uniref:SnoaL-like domain-containing protein n=1 Tax=Friedmanniella luteola TaxID=546871 RepID=A0A1H1RQ73_9ACTN|nr:nuclear transport factor 2 family protein [Friedmanniella luteola]SDS37875.1 SnoaL-like domain-containing protein [Friedmanniella luteola]
MTTDAPVAASRARSWTRRFPRDPQTRGWSQLPEPRVPGFSLLDLTRAVEEGDVDHQASCYAPAAEVLVVDPDNPPSAPQQLHGRPAIRAWLLHTRSRRLGLRVTDLVDGGDRVAFTERWYHQDGTTAVATSTAEIEHALITTCYTVLVWDHDPA